jgi:hypothetical protein
MGGKASEQLGVTVRNVGYAWIWAPPAPAPVTSPIGELTSDANLPTVTNESVVVESVTVAPSDAGTTITDIDGGLSLLGRWLIRFWLRISVRRTS